VSNIIGQKMRQEKKWVKIKLTSEKPEIAILKLSGHV